MGAEKVGAVDACSVFLDSVHTWTFGAYVLYRGLRPVRNDGFSPKQEPMRLFFVLCDRSQYELLVVSVVDALVGFPEGTKFAISQLSREGAGVAAPCSD